MSTTLSFNSLTRVFCGGVSGGTLACLLMVQAGLEPLGAAVIGTNTPAQPLTAARIASLPKAEQSAWKAYLKRSQKQWERDQNFLKSELKAHRMSQPLLPPSGRDANSVPLRRDAAWYGSAEACHIADIVISYQTPAGGWSKNLDMSRHLRQPGERFAEDNGSPQPMPADYDTPRDLRWNYVGTIDNNATTTQLRYLAQVASALPPAQSKRYQEAFLRGLDYLLAAQYPNGGWPQVWPLQGGYHDAVTYNDDAIIQVMEVMEGVANKETNYAFVPQPARLKAAASFQKGLRCILVSQIPCANGHHTIWCQQHDELTLQPTSARNYEMPSETSSESVGLVELLMDQPNPTPEMVAAVYDAMSWFQKTAIANVEVVRTAKGRELVHTPGKGPLWARFYRIGDDLPIFGDRDKTIHDQLDEISWERRNGYGWYRNTPAEALEQFGTWSKAHPLTPATRS